MNACLALLHTNRKKTCHLKLPNRSSSCLVESTGEGVSAADPAAGLDSFALFGSSVSLIHIDLYPYLPTDDAVAIY